MALEEMTTGPYTSTYNTAERGLSREGYNLQHSIRQQNIEGTDHYGDSLIDYVWRGANVTCDFTVLSFKKAIAATVLWPFAGNLYVLKNTATPIGRLASDLAKVLVLTVSANTPAAAVGFGPATLTADKAIMAPGANFRQLFDSRLREVPISLTLLPYDGAAAVVFGGAGAVVWAITT